MFPTTPNFILRPRGRSTHRQLADFARNYRRAHLGYQTQPTETMIAENVYVPDIDDTKAFFFSSTTDGNGCLYVGTRSKSDPQLIGITRQIDGIFHCDATYKTNKLRYPLITCGFTDSARQYHLVAIFVSRPVRERDFVQMFSGLEALALRVSNARPRAPLAMTDADDAQANAMKSLGGFKPLMCYYHVWYNVYKRVKHLKSSDISLVALIQ
ncbi:TPA: hypothetical protein N0F65_011156 [Lagenidium giganteum]|uniref:MULE transposase domain-containing protein n=1 Tax=Lagenidium giganteum TaxID=4803 RepID=A0AAV2Z985_9STRA|nr:TPA: hypothetical protein N0F65_011156 [Lagenidium giganteum]